MHVAASVVTGTQTDRLSQNDYRNPYAHMPRPKSLKTLGVIEMD